MYFWTGPAGGMAAPATPMGPPPNALTVGSGSRSRTRPILIVSAQPMMSSTGDCHRKWHRKSSGGGAPGGRSMNDTRFASCASYTLTPRSFAHASIGPAIRIVCTGPSPEWMTLSFEPNQPRLLMTSWHARPPVAKTRRAVYSGSSAIARTGRWYQCVLASPPNSDETTTVPSCEHEPTNSPVESMQISATAAECGVKRRISLPARSRMWTKPPEVPSARNLACAARQEQVAPSAFSMVSTGKR